jgi:hypothetical protein
VAVSRSAFEPPFASPGLEAANLRERRAAYGLVGFGLLTALLVALTQNPVLAAVPMVAVAAVWVVTKTRRLYLVLGLFAIYQIIGIAPLTLEGSPKPWNPPLLPLYRFLTSQLPIRMSGLELCYMGIFAVAIIRAVLGIRIDVEKRQSSSRLFFLAMLTILGGVFWLEVRGVMRGYADIKQTLWQFHGLIWLAGLPMFLTTCVRDTREVKAFAYMFTFVAMAKIAWGVYLFATVAWPYGVAPESMTGHEDSVLYTMCVFFWISACVHKPSKGAVLRLLFFGGWILYGIALNNRRIAYVCLLIGLMTFYLMLQGPMKRAATRVMLRAIPFIVVYLAIGAGRPHGIFKPAAMIMSVGEQKDASSQTRDIENFNLIQTLKPHMIAGTGWGYEYNEVVKADDISKFFPQYRYIAHNSVLWLVSIGGMIGFAILWIPIAVMMYLGMRSYQFSEHWMDKTAASTAVAVLGSFVVMAWGDMGTQGMMSGQVTATAFMVIAKLAYSTGAWPAGIKIFGHKAPPRRRAPRPGATPGPLVA